MSRGRGLGVSLMLEGSWGREERLWQIEMEGFLVRSQQGVGVEKGKRVSIRLSKPERKKRMFADGRMKNHSWGGRIRQSVGKSSKVSLCSPGR